MTVQLVFVVGNSRSGTTLLARCLGNHSVVFTCSELHFFEEMTEPSSAKNWDRERCLKAAAELLSRQEQGYLAKSRTPLNYLEDAENAIHLLTFPAPPEAVFAAVLGAIGQAHNAEFVVEQTPQNALFTDHILERIPEAKIIHILRDPRDVLASQKHKWQLRWRGVSQLAWQETIRVFFNYSPVLMTKLWVTTVSTTARIQDVERFHLVRYEDLVQEPQATLNSICEFLDLPFSQDILAARQEASSHFGDSDLAVGIHTGSVGKWKSYLTKGEIRICQYEARDAMARFGYEPTRICASYLPLWTLWYAILAPQLIVILILNANRYQHILRSIKRRFFQSSSAGLGS